MSLNERSFIVKKRKKNLIWDYYFFDSDLNKYICNECKIEYSSNSTTVFLREHLLKTHKSLSDKYLLDQSITDKFVSSQKYIVKKERREKSIENMFSIVLSIPSLSINTFLNDKVRDFFQLLNPNFAIPKSHGGLKSIVLEKQKETFINIKNFLKNNSYTPSLTIDIWSDQGLKNSYLGITLHVIENSLEIRLLRIFLGLMNLTNNHTHDIIKKETKKILELYSLDIKDVFKIITDNGTNVVKAFKESSSSEDEESESDFFKTIQLSENVIPLRASCFAHTLQLLIMDFINQCVKSTPAFLKLNIVVKKVRNSVLLKQELQKIAKISLINISLTRWGSYISVIGRYVELETELKFLSEKYKWINFNTDDEFIFLKKIYKLLNPFLDILKKIQAEKSVTISLCYVYIKILQKLLDDKINFLTLSDEINFLKERLYKRFSYIFDFDDTNFESIYLIAASLDPNTFNLLNDLELVKAKSFIKQLLPIENCYIFDVNIDLDKSKENEHDCSLNSYMEQIINDQNIFKRDESFKLNNIIDSCLEFINNSKFSLKNMTNCLKFWQTITKEEWQPLKQLAFKIFSVPATSAPIERVFSQAGLATQKHRNRTKFDLLNAQLMNYLNLDFN